MANGIVVSTKNGLVELTSKNFQAQLAFVKGIQGRKWNAGAKVWEIQMSKVDFISLAEKEGVYDRKLNEEYEQSKIAQKETMDEYEAIESVEMAIAKRYGKEVSIENTQTRQTVIARVLEDGETADEIADDLAKGMGWERIPANGVDFSYLFVK